MRFVTKLFVFAVALCGVLGVYKIGQAFRRDDRRVVMVEHRGIPRVPEVPEAPQPPEAVEAIEPNSIAGHAVASAEAAVAAAVASADAAVASSTIAEGPYQMRILTTNRAAFLSLRDDHLVAGLSDSLRRAVAMEMKKEMSKETNGTVGRAIEEAVRSGVSKIMQKEITVPVSEIRDIDYKNNRIVIAYKHGEAPGMINLETIKGDGDRSLLQQFSEADARKFVAAVKARIQ